MGISFDFFVNWKTRLISNPLWIKRLVQQAYNPWPVTESHIISNALHQCDGQEKIEGLCRFAQKYSLSCHYFLFKESPDFGRNPTPIIEVNLDGSSQVVNVTEIKLATLKERIQHLSGGPVTVGRKGLIYGLTSLECYLSTTSAAWPGDADLVLVDSNFTPVAIIEFKKHNLNTPIADQALANYYPRPDRRKYDRIALLRDHFPGEAPSIVVVYYSTQASFHEVKLELVHGKVGDLRGGVSTLVPLPNTTDSQSCNGFVSALLETIGYVV